MPTTNLRRRAVTRDAEEGWIMGEDRKKKLFEEHLPYELDMFDEAAKFLMSDDFKKLDRENNKDDWFRANAAIEALWTHARTLEEFFTQPKNPEPALEVHHASAQDFASDFRHDLDLETVIKKINAQVSHLNYARESLPPEKLSYEMKWVKAAIDKQVRRFQEALAAAVSTKKDLDREWGEAWKPRQLVEFIPTSDTPYSTSTFSVVSNLWTWPKGSTRPKSS
jgi:hypothetical protein